MDEIDLIINADDFGYFECVSRGIIEAVDSGSVTATGVMANGPNLARSISTLEALDAHVDMGVHLNLSLGTPVTDAMRNCLDRWAGRFPSKAGMVFALLGRQVRPDTVKTEWTAQIERCLELGIRPVFLNSHEHIHMLPSLYPVARELATAYGIPHVRHVIPEHIGSAGPSAMLRNLVIAVLGLASPRTHNGGSPRLLGLGASGRLSHDYLRRRLKSLREGQVYELMCHPGYYDPQEIGERRLIEYHEWESELRLLTDPSLGRELSRHGVRLIGYRDLPDHSRRR
jgi:predicted glycoside hydrolase/deacetylase ChbG (UPF0249 family)